MQTMSQTPVLRDHINISDLRVSAFTIPTDQPESDGTLEWDSTTLVLVEVEAANEMGIGYTYADAATAFFIDKTLKNLVVGSDALNIPSVTQNLIHHIRNQGTCGIAMMAVSAIDSALWDLKGKILRVPIASLLGAVRDHAPIYGSGGFTSYSTRQLQKQLQGWAEEGIRAVKMKIGREPDKDIWRTKAVREVIGTSTDLYVDANGAYNAREALEKAKQLAELNVTWFEEPVSSDDLECLYFLKEHMPPSVNLTAGEYGYNLPYFEHMLEAKAIDILQADATRCGGISGFLKAGHLSEAYQIPFSSHCAPSLHLQATMALPSFLIAEYFYDHVRIEKMLFDESLGVQNGNLKPDLSRPGLGLVFKDADAEKFKL